MSKLLVIVAMVGLVFVAFSSGFAFEHYTDVFFTKIKFFKGPNPNGWVLVGGDFKNPWTKKEAIGFYMIVKETNDLPSFIKDDCSVGAYWNVFKDEKGWYANIQYHPYSKGKIVRLTDSQMAEILMRVENIEEILFKWKEKGLGLGLVVIWLGAAKGIGIFSLWDCNKLESAQTLFEITGREKKH